MTEQVPDDQMSETTNVFSAITSVATWITLIIVVAGIVYLALPYGSIVTTGVVKGSKLIGTVAEVSTASITNLTSTTLESDALTTTGLTATNSTITNATIANGTATDMKVTNFIATHALADDIQVIDMEVQNTLIAADFKQNNGIVVTSPVIACNPSSTVMFDFSSISYQSGGITTVSGGTEINCASAGLYTISATFNLNAPAIPSGDVFAYVEDVVLSAPVLTGTNHVQSSKFSVSGVQHAIANNKFAVFVHNGHGSALNIQCVLTMQAVSLA